MDPHNNTTRRIPAPSMVLAGRYELKGSLGAGGMAEVFEATQRPFGRKVAIKFMRPEHVSDSRLAERFAQEAQTISRLHHPNTVQIYDFGQTEGGLHYIVMEHIEGVTLAEELRRHGALTFDQAIAYTIQIAQSLGEAHYKGIVHRDLKPDNVMVVRAPGTEAFVKVLDFGIAKILGPRASWTEAGSILGTPYYMAPEQAMQKPVDARADLYSLGCCLYEFLTGMPPFYGDTAMEVLLAHQQTPPPHLPGQFSRDLDRLLQRTMSKDPGARPPDTSTFIAELMMSAIHAPIQAFYSQRSGSGVAGAARPMGPASTLNMASLGQLFEGAPPLGSMRVSPKFSNSQNMLQFATPTSRVDDRRETIELVDAQIVYDMEFVEEAEVSSTNPKTPAPFASKPLQPPVQEAPEAPRITEADTLLAGQRVPDDSFEFDEDRPSQGLHAAPRDTLSFHRSRGRWRGVSLVLIAGGLVALVVLAGTLAPAFGSKKEKVTVQSMPEGALVKLEGIPVGRTPVELELDTEVPVSLQVSKRGFVPFEVQNARLTQGAVFAQLERRVLELTVSSGVPNATLSVGERVVGVVGQQAKTFEVEWPEDALVLTFRHPGYDDFIDRVPASRINQALQVSVDAEQWQAK